MERVAVDHLAAAKREDLHDSAVALEREPEHVDVADVTPVRRLPLREMLDREQTVAVPRRLLEPLGLGGLPHAALEVALDRVSVARQKLHDSVDDACVVLRGDVADTGRVAAVDVVVEARNTRMPSRFRALTRAEAKDAVEHVERLTNLLRVRIRSE